MSARGRTGAWLAAGSLAIAVAGAPAAAETFNADFSGKRIDREIVVAAPGAAVWQAWTEPEAMSRFFAPQARIELRPGGAFELLFLRDAPAGSQGSEGCTVLAFVPGEMLAFSWNAPPQFAAVRPLHTFVVVRLEPVDAGHTRVRLTHQGFGRGDEWARVHAYFERAWTGVLAGLADALKPAAPG